MIPGTFEYHAPRHLDDALGLLAEYRDDGKLLAGGQSLIPVMKLRLAEPKHIIDINRIAGLSHIAETSDELRIGALTRERDLERSDIVRQRYPLLLDTANVIADPLVRNLATVGGNLAHADPANDHPATMLAYRASVVALGPNGERVIPIDDFFISAFETTLQPDEILTEVRIPKPNGRAGGAYVKLERKVGDYAIAAAAVQLSFAYDGTIAEAGIAVTNVSYTPERSSAAEAIVRGNRLTDDVIRAAAQAAADACEPTADLRGSVEYKRAMTRTMTARALRLALVRAGA
ncbi:MAG: carbon monoxide dehydrogenase [Chloroflexi bacterium]|nr:MAG: carbon monoxide dehydrogenase [Chloroflexota bacterium]